MRTSFTLIAAVVLLAACSNDAEVTAPRSGSASTSQAYPPGPSSPVAYPPGPSGDATLRCESQTSLVRVCPRNANAAVQAYPPGPSAKPNSGPVVITVVGPSMSVNPSTHSYDVSVATCPAGSVVVGGGFKFTNGILGAEIVESSPDASNGWRAAAFAVIGGSPSTFNAVARCLQ